MTAFVVAIIVFAFFGAPIFAILASLAALGAEAARGDTSIWQAIASQLVRVYKLATTVEGELLSTIPLFTFMGYVLAEAKTAQRLVAVARAWLGWMPGGLAVVTVFICAFFTTVTGASGVTIVAVGGLVLPSLIKDGYKERFSLGLVTGTGSIGLLFPPSVPIIIYGVVYVVAAQGLGGGSGDTMTLVTFDLQKMLIAGILPGLVLCGLFAVYAVYRAVKDKVRREPFDLSRALETLWPALPELMIPGVMVFLLANPWAKFQVPEAAAATTLYVVILEIFLFRDVKFGKIPQIVRESLKLVGAIFILIVAATALTDYFVTAKIPDTLNDWITSHIESKYIFLIALNVMLLAVGFVMDIFSALVVIVPLIVPTAIAYGIDPYHLGVIFLLNLEVGYVHPPVGLNLFISAYRFHKPMTELYWAIIPFVFIMLASLIIVTYVPSLTTVMTGSGKAKEAEPAKVEVDAGVGDEVKIPLGDGTFFTMADCEKPEVKDDPMAYLECQNKFKLWPRCDKEFTEELDRLECRQKVIEGKDPFDPNAEDEEEEEEEEVEKAAEPDAAQ